MGIQSPMQTNSSYLRGAKLVESANSFVNKIGPPPGERVAGRTVGQTLVTSPPVGVRTVTSKRLP
jgi:hypothetical protein